MAWEKVTCWGPWCDRCGPSWWDDCEASEPPHFVSQTAARRQLAENRMLLDGIWRRFNVEPRFIVALWGIESDFGKVMGNYSVVSALATLAYDGRRSSYFRGEVISAGSGRDRRRR